MPLGSDPAGARLPSVLAPVLRCVKQVASNQPVVSWPPRASTGQRSGQLCQGLRVVFLHQRLGSSSSWEPRARISGFLPVSPLPCLAAQDLSPLLEGAPKGAVSTRHLSLLEGTLPLPKYGQANQRRPVLVKNKQSHLIFRMYVFPVCSLALPWHFYGSRRPLSCQQWSIASTLSLNYTITLLCTVVRAIKHLKHFKQI